MSSKTEVTMKCSCDKLKSPPAPATNKKVKIKLPKKVVISKKWHRTCSHEVKSHSAGVIDEATEGTGKPKKVTKSESTVHRNTKNIDYCKKCGDTDDDIITAVSEYTGKSDFTRTNNETAKNTEERSKRTNTTENQKHTIQEYYKNENFEGYIKITGSKNTKKIIANDPEGNCDKEEKEIIQEYYKNERFQDLYDSMHEMDNGLRNLGTLDTIAEVNEKQTLSNKSSESIYIVESSDEETNVKELKNFRDRNYFECHSGKTRVKSKGSVTSLKEHKCSYRFYLNDRLFPIAVNGNHNDCIRCVDCHLPLEMSSKDTKVNGTIQAKVKLGDETKDTVLLLPVKEPLIVQQRRKEKKDNEVVYFGLIKLDQNGNSIFKRSLPSDSLALKYQKGYREFNCDENYRYKKLEEADIIVI
ncbi:hypothetical protein MSG28_005450 [Choristoneura fumiferana]|uniref:Uncharacterized protein n=1 Tax=Choristoneura fumiferana TaxID=7141 RepID=A0ACC0KZY2_CHOFU|nr:hypothetical protein MSG28_005450 [Choristoneura fumiferana]